MMFSCSNCCSRSFRHKFSLMAHVHDRHGGYPKHHSKCLPCSQCSRMFSWEVSLLQHETLSLHNPKPKRRNRRKKATRNHGGSQVNFQSIDSFIESFQSQAVINNNSLTSKLTEYYNNKVVVDPSDRKQSKAKARRIVQNLMTKVRSMPGGSIYSFEVQAAGSTGTGTKINVADEFDFNVPLNVDVAVVKVRK